MARPVDTAKGVDGVNADIRVDRLFDEEVLPAQPQTGGAKAHHLALIPAAPRAAASLFVNLDF